jgi:hypothetical protein
VAVLAHPFAVYRVTHGGMGRVMCGMPGRGLA